MSETTLEQAIMEQVRRLTAQQKQQLLDIARGLGRPQGIPGALAVQYAHEIDFPADDLAEIEAAIEAVRDTEWPT